MEDIIERANNYREHSWFTGGGHYKAGKKAAQKNKVIGISVVITATLVGTSIFATIQVKPELHWVIIAGLLSYFAAVLSALQTFFKFTEQAKMHKMAGAKYGTLRRDIDLFILRYKDADERKREPALADLKEITDRFGKLAEDSPDLPDKFYKQIMEEYYK